MSGECQVNIKSLSELDIGGRETCFSQLLFLSWFRLTYIQRSDTHSLVVRLIEECSFLLPQDYHLATNAMTLFDVKLSIKFFTTFNFFVNQEYAKMKDLMVLKEALKKLFWRQMSNLLRPPLVL